MKICKLMFFAAALLVVNTAVAHWLDQKHRREVVQFRTDG